MALPVRKYARVSYHDSLAFKHSGCLVDAGLTMGRSFRVGWGPGGLLLHSGRVIGVSELR
jgi:nuclear pore complex protein Nup98-Nup96